jgi:hypothetical protein
VKKQAIDDQSKRVDGEEDDACREREDDQRPGSRVEDVDQTGTFLRLAGSIPCSTYTTTDRWLGYSVGGGERLNRSVGDCCALFYLLREAVGNGRRIKTGGERGPEQAAGHKQHAACGWTGSA